MPSLSSHLITLPARCKPAAPQDALPDVADFIASIKKAPNNAHHYLYGLKSLSAVTKSAPSAETAAAALQLSKSFATGANGPFSAVHTQMLAWKFGRIIAKNKHLMPQSMGDEIYRNAKRGAQRGMLNLPPIENGDETKPLGNQLQQMVVELTFDAQFAAGEVKHKPTKDAIVADLPLANGVYRLMPLPCPRRDRLHFGEAGSSGKDIQHTT